MAAGAETHFARILASNEKTVRDKAVKKLRWWISTSRSVTSGLPETDLLKLWKGLFYCMWMSDKPKVQEELAETIAQLLHSFNSTNSALDFLGSFFKTICREWHGIDRLRLDKFYLLIRKFVYQSFLFLKNHGWDPETNSLLNKTLEDGLLSSVKVPLQIPEGVQSHVIQVYLDELVKVDTSKIPSSLLVTMFEPFSHLLATSKSKVITKALCQCIFDQLLEQAGKDEESGCCVKVDLKGLGDQLFSFASRQDIPARNRNTLYHYIKKFRKASGRNNDGENKTEVKYGLANGVGHALTDHYISRNKCLSNSEVNNEDLVEEKDESMFDGEHDNPGKVSCFKGCRKKASKIKKEGIRKRKCEEPTEDSVTDDPNMSKANKDVDSKTMIKRTKSKDNRLTGEGPGSESGLETVSQEKRQRRKKRKSDSDAVVSSENVEDKTAEEELLHQAIRDSDCDQEDTSGLDGSYLSIIPTWKPESRSLERKCVGPEVPTVLNNKSVKLRTKETKKLRSDGILSNTSRTRTNGEGVQHFSGNGRTSAESLETRIPNTASVECDDPGENKESQDIAATPRSPSPAAFLRHSVKKAKINTDVKTRKEEHSVSGPANSIPDGSKKQVRIELSQNTSHTTQDYRRSLKSSPVVPFDAAKRPAQSSLKATAAATLSHLRSSKRPSAADFF